MNKYIWQLDGWHHPPAPHFRWNASVLEPRITELQIALDDLLPSDLAPVPDAQMQVQIDTLVQTALRSSEIEGEALDARSVRSSVVNKLGLDSAGIANTSVDAGTVQTDALAELLIRATTQLELPLTQDMLCDWQAALFVTEETARGSTTANSKTAGSTPTGSINIGSLRGEGPMQVVSGRIDRPRVHFEAPPGDILEAELARFLQWFNHPPSDLNPYLRAAITHLWFVTLHPFDDGNGRVTRALADRALAQADNNSIRFYSHSAAIMAKRNEYYSLLEKTQKGTLEITEWLSWFLATIVDAIALSKTRFEQVIIKTRFWQRHAQTVLNEREIKVLNRLLDSYGEEFANGINASKYRSLGKVSKATRELADLVNKGCLVKLPGGGRSTRYRLAELV